jgi:hypothetical protein
MLPRLEGADGVGGAARLEQARGAAEERAAYDQGGDIKSRRGGGESDGSDGSDEEQQQSLREEIERKYFPERCAARLTMPPPGALPCSLS